MRVEDFTTFILKREMHRLWRETGERPKKPDPIISQYRFCNVRRNDDRVTKWVFANYMDHFIGSSDLWFALVVARLLNKETTLAQVRDFTLPFDKKMMRSRLKKIRQHGPIFNGAYIVSTNGRAMDKVDYIVDEVLSPLWKKRQKISRIVAQATELEEVHKVLMAEQGLGSFMAAQVVADLKYAEPTRWEDFHTFVASGPGSRRGLNRVMGALVNSPWQELDFRACLRQLQEATNQHLKGAMVPITAQDVQNCLCEFDKYERVRLGEGKPKQKYKMENQDVQD
jgi:hypothetical protein